jgi:hypothetical protein
MDPVFLDNPLGIYLIYFLYISYIFLIYILYISYITYIGIISSFVLKMGESVLEPEAIPGSWTPRLGCGSASKCGPNGGKIKNMALSSQLGYPLVMSK